MINFNELRITPDGKHLIVDVLVDSLSYYDNVYIDSIRIDTQNTFVETGPSTLPIYVYVTPEEGEKHLRLILDIDTISDNLFFVWVITRGTPSEDTPCGMKESMILGAVYNEYPIYTESMKYLNALDGCNPPKEFIDFILRTLALDLSLKTGNHIAAIEYWNKLFKKKLPNLSNTCGCNGVA